MTKNDIIRKLTSRKFWVAVCDFVSMLIIAIGYAESAAAQITALIMAGAGALAFILAEGWSDANAAANVVVTVEDDPNKIGF